VTEVPCDRWSGRLDTLARAARPVPSPPTLGSPVSGRHARFEALLPPGVRSATIPIPGQARTARRCSLGVLDLPELAPLRFRVRFLAQTHAGGKAPCHVHLRAPSHRGCMPRPGLRRLGSRAQDPSTRGVYRTPRITVRRRPSSRAFRNALVRQPPAPPPRPCRTWFGRRVLPVPPLRRHPAPPCPSRPTPPDGGASRWTSKTLFR
jgi:hypothetical protein